MTTRQEQFNVVFILIDSLRRDALSAYGPTRTRTPTIDEFAATAVRFDNHFVGSLPCMPARREIFAGRKEMLWRPWGPLEAFDARLPRMLAKQGYRTAIVTDHYHYWEEAANGYLQSFESSSLIRGHEYDNWRPVTTGIQEAPQWVRNVERWRPGSGLRYYANVAGFEGEEDYFPARVFTEAGRWLRDYDGEDPFYLHIESFDVHEPFDVPEPYASMYGDAGLRERYTIWPEYQNLEGQNVYLSQASEEELEFIRSQYAAKVTMVDRWLGHFLETLEELGHRDDTIVVITTDHGHDLAERGHFGKEFPHPDSHAQIPLFIRHPAVEQGSVDHLTSTVDLHPTLLEAAGAEPESVHGRSLLPLISGEDEWDREGLIYGTFGHGVCCTDGRYTLVKSPRDPEAPLFAYSSQIYPSLNVNTLASPVEQGCFIPGVELPQWKIPVRVRPRFGSDLLYDRSKDPGQEHDLWEERPEVRRRMLELTSRLMAEEGTPDELWNRLGLKQAPDSAGT